MSDFFVEHGAALVGGAFLFVVLILVFAVIRGSGRTRKRKEDIKQWAFRNGFDYVDGPMPARELAPIAHFDNADAYNVTRGSRIAVMDLRRTIGSTGDTSTRITSSVLFQLSEPLPPFTFMAISAEGPDSMQGQILGKMMGLAKAAGGDSLAASGMVMIESHPGFLIRSPQPDRVRPLFAEDRVRFFDDKIGWGIECEGSWLLLSKQDLADAEHYDEFVHAARSIHDHFVSART
jgi:hypothetical protein